MGMYLYCQNTECGSYVDGMDCMCGWKQPLPEPDCVIPLDLKEAIEAAIDYVDEECYADHHGYCQAHSLQPIDTCYVKILKYYRDNS